MQTLATRRVKAGNAAIPIGSTGAKSTSIYARKGAPAIAVNDGKIVKIGQNAAWGRFVQLQDQTGNTYTYAHLGSTSRMYAVPKPTQVSAAQLAKNLIMPVLPAPKQPASAGAQQASAPVSAKQATQTVKQTVSLKAATQAQSTTASAPVVTDVKQRLFAYPSRPASYAAGGKIQLRSTQLEISDFRNYFSDVLHLAKDQYTLAPLKAGSIVLAGTILGRVGPVTGGKAPHMEFMIQPAGRGAPLVDPKPILDGWKLLEATAVYRASGVDPFFGPGAKNPSVGQILLMSKEQLQTRILQDPHVQMSICERRAVQAGQSDRRVLAAVEFLSASGLDPTISGITCATGSNPISGTSVNITRINNLPVAGHQGTGSLADLADPAAAHPPGRPEARSDHQRHQPQGPARDARAARSHRPDPDHLHPGLRRQQAALRAGRDDPQGRPVDRPDQPHQQDRRAVGADDAEQVRAPGERPLSSTAATASRPVQLHPGRGAVAPRSDAGALSGPRARRCGLPHPRPGDRRARRSRAASVRAQPADGRARARTDAGEHRPGDDHRPHALAAG